MDAHQQLEVGISLTEQGWCDEAGEAPALLLDWIKHVARTVAEVRAKQQEEALKAARDQRR